MTLPRPAAATRPLLVLMVMTAVVFVIGRGTGSNWLALLSSGLLATLFLSAILPGLALSGARLRVRAPADGTVGRPLAVTVEVTGRLWDARLRVGGPPGEWVRAEGAGQGEVTMVPARRGVVDRLAVEVRSSAPLGLVWWRLPLVLALGRPLEVGPHPQALGAPTPTTGEAGVTAAAAAAPLPTGLPELVRSLRDYVPGDAMRLVSWTATARYGRLLVKEMEGQGASRLTLVVDLRGEEAAAEEAASRAAGLALSALAEGITVVLATAERAGGRLDRVSTAREVSRRLARAVGDAPPPVPPDGAVAGAVMRVAAR